MKSSYADPVETPPTVDERVTLVGLLLEAHRGLTREFQPIQRRHGLSPTEFTALLRTSRSPGGRLRMSDLAAQIGLSTSGVTTLVERLIGRGLMDRAADPCDQRALVVTLTGAGRELLAGTQAEMLPVIERCLVAPLGEDLPAFAASLARVRDVVEPNATAGADRLDGC